MKISEMVKLVLELESDDDDISQELFARKNHDGTTVYDTGDKAVSMKNKKSIFKRLSGGIKKTGGAIAKGAKLANEHRWKTAAGLGTAGSVLGALTNHPYAAAGSAGAVPAALGIAAAVKKLNEMRKKRAAIKADVSGNI
jgi:hypothetical protein